MEGEGGREGGGRGVPLYWLFSGFTPSAGPPGSSPPYVIIMPYLLITMELILPHSPPTFLQFSTDGFLEGLGGFYPIFIILVILIFLLEAATERF